MNLFRKWLGIVSLALISIAGMTAATPAQAYVINCTGSGTTWPSTGVQACGPTGGIPTAQRNAVLTAVQAVNVTMPDAYSKLTAFAIPVLVFRNPTELSTYYTERGFTPPTVPLGAPGAFTAYHPTTGIPVNTYIFSDNTGSYSANAAVHELGHTADYLYRGLAYTSPTGFDRVSFMFLFRNLVVQDRASFDRLSYPVSPTPAVAQCGAGGIFSNSQDAFGTWICSSSGAGSSLNTATYPNGTANSDILDIGFTNIMQTANSQGFREMFAEAFAVVNGSLDGGVKSLDKYWAGTRFNCTKKFVQKVGMSGVRPTQTELETWGCVIPCRAYPTPPQSNFPLNGVMYNCMGYPRSSAEAFFQDQVMNSANGSAADFTLDQKNKFDTKNVDIYVYYNGGDALLGKRLDITGGTVKLNEMGRSFVEAPVGNSTLPRPSSIVWAYNRTDWAALTDKIPDYPTSTTFPGTVKHELAHQIDRIWAKDLAYAPTATSLISLNSTNQAYYLKAIAWDWAAMSAADKATLWSSYPYTMVNATTVDNYQMFAAQATANTGLGGSTAYSFIAAKFKCSTWVVNQLTNSNGIFPPAPDPGLHGQCYGNTTW